MITTLDWPKAEIRMYADTEVERTKRLGACQKEPETVAWVESLPEGSVLFDIGANTGAYSLIASYVGLRVVSFEPSAPNFDHLVRNFRLNGLEATLIDAPLWKCEEEVEFCYSSREPGAALHQINGHSPDREMKQAYPLDWWVFPPPGRGALALPQPDHIKLDVDGCELEILQGAQKTLRRVQGLLVETDRTEPSHRVVRPLLEDWGFKVESIHPHGESPVANIIYTRSTP